MERSKLSEAVLQIRKAAGETQQAFSTRLGMSMSSLCNFECGRRSPSGEQLAALIVEADRLLCPVIAARLRSELLRQMPSLLFALKGSPTIRQEMAAGLTDITLSGAIVSPDRSDEWHIIARAENHPSGRKGVEK